MLRFKTEIMRFRTDVRCDFRAKKRCDSRVNHTTWSQTKQIAGITGDFKMDITNRSALIRKGKAV